MTITIVEKQIISEIREFHANRTKKIREGKTPKPLDNKDELSKIIFHIVPIKAFDSSMIFNLSQLGNDLITLTPIYSSVWNGQYNFDGFITYGHSVARTTGLIGSYVQFFHNGIIEAVDMRLLHDGYIHGPKFKQGLVEALPRYLSCQRKIGVEPPLFVMLSMLKVQGFQLASEQDSLESRNIDRDNLVFPKIQIENWDTRPEESLKPLFDILWNAAGLPESSLS